MARGKNGAARAQRNGQPRRTRRAGAPAHMRRRTHMRRGMTGGAIGGDVAAMRAEIDEMIGALEQRLQRLNQLTKRGALNAAQGANDLVLDAVSGLADRVSSRMQNRTRRVSNQVARFGNQALQRVAWQIDHRPLLTLAIIAGVGFIAGLARRTD